VESAALTVAIACAAPYYHSMTLSDRHDSKPVYVRLRDIIAEAILSGQFSDGDPLPSVRAFAAEQGANPLTVAKAYQGFQDEGLIVVRRGVGMFVADGARERLSSSEREQFLRSEWPTIRARMDRLGIDPAELLELQ
jgi:GntR family transcriptional regulator